MVVMVVKRMPRMNRVKVLAVVEGPGVAGILVVTSDSGTSATASPVVRESQSIARGQDISECPRTSERRLKRERKEVKGSEKK